MAQGSAHAQAQSYAQAQPSSILAQQVLCQELSAGQNSAQLSRSHLQHKECAALQLQRAETSTELLWAQQGLITPSGLV